MKIEVLADYCPSKKMKILDVEIQDIGPFKGSHTLSFFSSRKRNVHVIVGVNATGKTIILNAICWAMGLYDPKKDKYIKRWIHDDCQSGSVTLRLEVDGQVYAISRTAIELTDSSNYFSNDLEVFLENEGLQKDKTIFQQEVFSDLKPKILRYLILHSQENFFELGDHQFVTPEFVNWVTERITTVEIPWITDRMREGYISAAFECIGGPRSFMAAGERAIASMLLHSLFREWIFLVTQTPFGHKHLGVESFPWLMDCPFSVLDKEHQEVAALLISGFKGTVVICTNDAYRNLVPQPLLGSIGSISAIRCGRNLRDRNHVSVLGESLELSRNDNTEFSELISYKS